MEIIIIIINSQLPLISHNFNPRRKFCWHSMSWLQLMQWHIITTGREAMQWQLTPTTTEHPVPASPPFQLERWWSFHIEYLRPSGIFIGIAPLNGYLVRNPCVPLRRVQPSYPGRGIVNNTKGNKGRGHVWYHHPSPQQVSRNVTPLPPILPSSHPAPGSSHQTKPADQSHP